MRIKSIQDIASIFSKYVWKPSILPAVKKNKNIVPIQRFIQQTHK